MTEPKQVLIPRYERKFDVNGLPFNVVEQIIRLNPACFREVYYPRSINNIYLDTHEKKSWRGNVNGDPDRVKTRIRWYGELFGNAESPTLEFKVKNGLLGRKPAYKLPDFHVDSSITKTAVQEIVRAAVVPPEVLGLIYDLEPTLLNCYKRKYYLSGNKKIRLTLDSELTYYKFGANNNHFRRTYVEDNVIVEVKYNSEDDHLVSDITKSFPFRLTKKSKYVSGVYNTIL